MSLETLVKPEQQYKNGTDSWPWFFLLKKPCRQWKYVSRPKCFSMALPYQKSRSTVFMLPEKGVPSAVIGTVHRWCWDCTAGLEESSTGEVPQLQKFCCRNCWVFAAPCKSKCVCHVACVCQLACGHTCGVICHPAPCCSDTSLCVAKVRVKCPCGRRKAEAPCCNVHAGTANVHCDGTCHAAKQQQIKVGTALVCQSFWNSSVV